MQNEILLVDSLQSVVSNLRGCNDDSLSKLSTEPRDVYGTSPSLNSPSHLLLCTLRAIFMDAKGWMWGTCVYGDDAYVSKYNNEGRTFFSVEEKPSTASAEVLKRWYVIPATHLNWQGNTTRSHVRVRYGRMAQHVLFELPARPAIGQSVHVNRIRYNATADWPWRVIVRSPPPLASASRRLNLGWIRSKIRTFQGLSTSPKHGRFSREIVRVKSLKCSFLLIQINFNLNLSFSNSENWNNSY